VDKCGMWTAVDMCGIWTDVVWTDVIAMQAADSYRREIFIV